MNILEQIIRTKREEVEERKNKISERDLKSTVFAARERLSMRQALEKAEVGIIAEFKRKSPSRGFIHENASVTDVVAGYAANGASACSILTDTSFFGGSLLDLAMARKAVNIPLLRKDFIVDAYQITEAMAYGADAILLIAAALSPEQCAEYTAIAHVYGMEVLLEIHQPEEMDRIGPETDMIGVNNRNLATFQTDVYTSFELAKQIPSCYMKVSESGIHALETIRELREAGYRGFLMGEYFMKNKRPELALKEFLSYAG